MWQCGVSEGPHVADTKLPHTLFCIFLCNASSGRNLWWRPLAYDIVKVPLYNNNPIKYSPITFQNHLLNFFDQLFQCWHIWATRLNFINSQLMSLLSWYVIHLILNSLLIFSLLCYIFSYFQLRHFFTAIFIYFLGYFLFCLIC